MRIFNENLIFVLRKVSIFYEQDFVNIPRILISELLTALLVPQLRRRARKSVPINDSVASLSARVTPRALRVSLLFALCTLLSLLSDMLTKHILRHAYELQDRVARRVFEPTFVDSASQLADILTKSLRPQLHRALVPMLLHCPSSSTLSSSPAVTRSACSSRERGCSPPT